MLVQLSIIPVFSDKCRQDKKKHYDSHKKIIESNEFDGIVWSSKQHYFTYCSEYLMTHGSGVFTVVVEAATSRVVQVLFSSNYARHNFKVFSLPPPRPKKIVLQTESR